MLIVTKKNKQIYSFPNTKSEDMFYQKRLADSRFQIYNWGFTDEFILVEVILSKSVEKHFYFFNEYERNQILRRQTRILLNTVPKNTLYWLEQR